MLMKLAPSAACCLLLMSVSAGDFTAELINTREEEVQSGELIQISSRQVGWLQGPDGEQCSEVPPGNLPEDRGVPADRKGAAGGG